MPLKNPLYKTKPTTNPTTAHTSEARTALAAPSLSDAPVELGAAVSAAAGAASASEEELAEPVSLGLERPASSLAEDAEAEAEAEAEADADADADSDAVLEESDVEDLSESVD